MKATVTSSERHPASLVLGSRTLTPLIVQRPTSRGDLETAVQIHTHQKHTHTHTTHTTLCIQPRQPQRISHAVHSLCPTRGAQMRGPDSSQGPGQGWAPPREEGHLLFCTKEASGLPRPPLQHSSRPTCRLSGLLDRRALGPPSPPHWKSLSHVGSPPLRCSGCPPPGPGSRCTSALPSPSPSVTHYPDLAVMVHLFSTRMRVWRLLGPGPGLGAAGAERTRSSSQSVGVGHLQANGHTQRAGPWQRHLWELREPRGGTCDPNWGSCHGELLRGDARP